MLEMGSMNFGELRLMSKGVDRSVALQLGIPPNVDDVEEFLENVEGRSQNSSLDTQSRRGSSRLSASRVLTQAHFHRQLRTIVCSSYFGSARLARVLALLSRAKKTTLNQHSTQEISAVG